MSKTIAKHRKDTKVQKRINSAEKYLDSLTDKYSKLLMVRVDLGYKKPYSQTTSIEKADEDFIKMLDNRRSKPTAFKNLVGYISKAEYTKDRGVHYHTIFMFNGQNEQKDAHKAKQIGEYWSKNITNNTGSYHNCSYNKYKENGLGLLKHNDTEKIKIVKDKVIPYLCKDEQSIEPIKGDKKVKAFRRGVAPKINANKGRPRES